MAEAATTNPVEQLINDPAFLALPADLREETIVHAIKSMQAGSPTPTATPRTPRGGLSEEGTFEQETTPTPESTYATRPFFPGLNAQMFQGDPQLAEQRAQQEQQGHAQDLQSLKTNALPMVGSVAGTAIGGSLGGVPGAAIGDVLGTAGGYAANVGLGIEPFDPLRAAMVVGPSAGVNAYSGAVRPLAAALTRSSKTGQQVALERVNQFVGQQNAQRTAQDAAARATFEQGQAATQASTERARQNVQNYNTQQTAQDAAAKTAFEQGQARQTSIAQTQADAVKNFNANLQTAQGTADATVEAFNARAKADFELSRALQDQSKARQAAQYADDLKSWQVVQEQQRVQKTLQAERYRGLRKAQQEEHVGDAAMWAASLPEVPSRAVVQQAYAGVQEIAQANNVVVSLPKTQALRKEFLAEAASARKLVGDSPLAASLESLGNAGKEAEVSLTDLQTGLSLAKAHVKALAGSTSEYAGTQRRAYGRLVGAMEQDLETLADSANLPLQFRTLLKIANKLNLRANTAEEVTDFVTKTLVVPNAEGVPSLNPQAGLRALNQKGTDDLVRYMKATTFTSAELGGGPEKSLYDLFQETFREMTSKSFAEAEVLRKLKQTGGVALGPKPVDPASQVSATGIPNKPLQQTAPDLGSPLPVPSVPTAQAYQGQAQTMTVPPAYSPQRYQSKADLLQPLTGTSRPGLGATVTDITTRAALTGAAGLAYGTGNYGPMAVALGAAATAPQVISQLLMTPTGQKTLLALVKAQGPRLTPAMMGFLSAATAPRATNPAAQTTP